MRKPARKTAQRRTVSSTPTTPQVMQPEKIEPTYMVVSLSHIDKRTYDRMSKVENVTARRPNGFIVTGTEERLLYINEDDRYYEGKLDKDYTDKMFMERPTKGVEVITRIVFTKAEQQN